MFAIYLAIIVLTTKTVEIFAFHPNVSFTTTKLIKQESKQNDFLARYPTNTLFNNISSNEMEDPNPIPSFKNPNSPFKNQKEIPVLDNYKLFFPWLLSKIFAMANIFYGTFLVVYGHSNFVESQTKVLSLARTGGFQFIEQVSKNTFADIDFTRDSMIKGFVGLTLMLSSMLAVYGYPSEIGNNIVNFYVWLNMGSLSLEANQKAGHRLATVLVERAIQDIKFLNDKSKEKVQGFGNWTWASVREFNGKNLNKVNGAHPGLEPLLQKSVAFVFKTGDKLSFTKIPLWPGNFFKRRIIEQVGFVLPYAMSGLVMRFFPEVGLRINSSLMATSVLMKGLTTALNNKQPEKSVNNQETVKDGVDKWKDGVDKWKDGVDKLKDNEKKFKDGVEKLKDGAEKWKDGVEKLKDNEKKFKDGVEKFKDGAEKLKDGVDKLKDNEKKFKDGVEILKDGVEKLKDNEKKLKDGVEILKDGVNAEGWKKSFLFKDGIKKVKDKAGELHNKLLNKSESEKVGLLQGPNGGLLTYALTISALTMTILVQKEMMTIPMPKILTQIMTTIEAHAREWMTLFVKNIDFLKATLSSFVSKKTLS